MRKAHKYLPSHLWHLYWPLFLLTFGQLGGCLLLLPSAMLFYLQHRKTNCSFENRGSGWKRRGEGGRGGEVGEKGIVRLCFQYLSMGSLWHHKRVTPKKPMKKILTIHTHQHNLAWFVFIGNETFHPNACMTTLANKHRTLKSRLVPSIGIFLAQ